MQHILRIDRVSRTLAERKVVNSIQQVGFSHAVLPKKTVQLGRKRQVSLCNILIIQYGDAV